MTRDENGNVCEREKVAIYYCKNCGREINEYEVYSKNGNYFCDIACYYIYYLNLL